MYYKLSMTNSCYVDRIVVSLYKYINVIIQIGYRMKKYCKVCNSQIPEGRVKLGYRDTCTKHSDTFKYVGFVVTDAKSGDSIDIVKDPQVARDMERLHHTRGAY
jgi:hypothetical protein